MRKQRLTMKLSLGGGRLAVEHVDLDVPVSEAQFRAEAKSVAERLGKKVATRPAAKARAKKQTASRESNES